MDPRFVDQQLLEIERQLRIDDPAYLDRIDRHRRRATVQATTVVALLLSSAVLLAAGLATVSPVAYCAGTAALLAAFPLERKLAPASDHEDDLPTRRGDHGEHSTAGDVARRHR